MTQPYTYVVTWYPAPENMDEKPRILYSGVIIAASQEDAYYQMVNIVKPGNTLDPEEIEFMAKPFLDDYGCDTKRSLAHELYKFYMNNNTWSVKNSTEGWSDYGFKSYDYEKPKVPKVMMMIDVLALINDNKTL
jgi:hypothetical protein